MYLIGLGVGSLFAGPFSETLGRNAIYLGTTVVFILFIMAKALAPNYGAAIVFRFIAAFFGAAPLTCLGGSIGDIWNPLELTYSLPFTTIFSYLAPFVGPVIGAYLPGVGFEWADWISMIIAAAVLVIFALFQPETYGPLLLEWKAHHLRDLTGDKRYQVDAHVSATSLARRLLVNIYRPFEMTATEPIILIFSFYLIILYIVLFTFLEGYPFIFTETYGISKSLTFILWAGMLAGDSTALLLIPLLHGWTKKAAAKAEAKGEPLQPEVCMYWAMMGGSILLPISLFWMGWTCYVRPFIFLSLFLPIPCCLSNTIADSELALHQHLVPDCRLVLLRLRCCDCLYHNLPLYLLHLHDIRRVSSHLHDFQSLRYLRRAATCRDPDVHNPRPAFRSYSSGLHYGFHGTCTISTIPLWP